MFKLVQNVCYAWNWAVHDEILRSQPFKTLLDLPFMSQCHVIDQAVNDSEKVRACRTT
jgi:hypothetical protein